MRDDIRKEHVRGSVEVAPVTKKGTCERISRSSTSDKERNM